jgi:hypothetical protein
MLPIRALIGVFVCCAAFAVTAGLADRQTPGNSGPVSSAAALAVDAAPSQGERPGDEPLPLPSPEDEDEREEDQDQDPDSDLVPASPPHVPSAVQLVLVSESRLYSPVATERLFRPPRSAA